MTDKKPKGIYDKIKSEMEEQGIKANKVKADGLVEKMKSELYGDKEEIWMKSKGNPERIRCGRCHEVMKGNNYIGSICLICERKDI